ncbi:hypothetical protein WA588_006571, partial [Blastocystis sp. NMH]
LISSIPVIFHSYSIDAIPFTSFLHFSSSSLHYSILCSIFYDLSISYPYFPSSLLNSAIPSHSLPIHIQSLLYLFISSVIIPLFVIALNFSFPFILISTHPILSLLLCYSLSILQSIFFSVTPHSPLLPPSLLYSILIHPLIILPIHSFPQHPLSPILFSFHPSFYSI